MKVLRRKVLTVRHSSIARHLFTPKFSFFRAGFIVQELGEEGSQINPLLRWSCVEQPEESHEYLEKVARDIQQRVRSRRTGPASSPDTRHDSETAVTRLPQDLVLWRVQIKVSFSLSQ